MKDDFKTRMSVFNYVKNLDFSFGYDYENLIEQIKQDAKKYQLKNEDIIIIVRDENHKSYPPITDYYIKDNEIKATDINNAREVQLRDLLFELNYLNDIVKNNKKK